MNNKLPKIGYLYHYPHLDHPGEKFRLDIFISSVPTGEHFDVQHAHFHVKTPEETIEKLTVTHPWTLQTAARVCVGVIVMEDRNKAKKEAFTFGGKLKIENQPEQTFCTLSSNAPILDISDASPTRRFFIDELEILFAERQASFTDHRLYDKKLIQADPLELYLASLKYLIEKFEAFPHKNSTYRQFLTFLHTERHRLHAAQIAIETAPTLDEIFRH
jgi:hypothetical protein